jgi:hypothetical protein
MAGLPCNVRREKYQDISNHCRRVPITNTDHARKLDEVFPSPIDNEDVMSDAMDTADGPSPRKGGDVIDVIFLASQQVCAMLVHGETLIYCVCITQGC